MGYTYLDTGAMYRAVTYEAQRLGLESDDEIIAMAKALRMTVAPGDAGMRVFLDEREVTGSSARRRCRARCPACRPSRK